MGADLLSCHLRWPNDLGGHPLSIGPDLVDVVKGKITETLNKMSDEDAVHSNDCFIAHSAEDSDDWRSDIADRLTPFVEMIFGDGHWPRNITTVNLDGTEWLFAAETSWGDCSDELDMMWLLGELGILDDKFSL